MTYRMPGEFEPHRGTIIIWPERPGSWNYGAVAARVAFADVIKAAARSEEVFVAVNERSRESAELALASTPNVTIFTLDTNDSWARDVAPTFVKNEVGDVTGISWTFNAWGGAYDGLYADFEKDDAFAAEFCKRFDYKCMDAAPFVLEGGAIHSDGEGTVMVTESCLLSPGRNPKLSKEQIEENLKKFLGAEKILWLPRGIYNDETNEHVDNVCAFIKPGEVVLAWTDNVADPQYELSKASYDYLANETDAKGRKIIIHKLPIPDVPITMTAQDVAGFTFEDGEDMREVGERLAASYVNFYFTNDAVLLPVFGGENKASDSRAIEIMSSLVAPRKVIPIPARDILTGGGNIHCITQQIPK